MSGLKSNSQLSETLSLFGEKDFGTFVIEDKTPTSKPFKLNFLKNICNF